MPTIDIDSDAAQEAAQRELAKPIYPKPSLTERIIEWIDDLLYRLAAEGSSVPGGWLTIAVLVLLLAAAALVATRIGRRAMRSRGRSLALFTEHELSAAAHRATAQRYAAEHDWAPAIRHRLRAVARQLEESAVLDPVPGRTATEFAHDAGRSLPHLIDELHYAADAFNDVTYGELPGTEAAYRRIADLDDHLTSGAPTATTTTAAPLSSDGWAEVR